jgi:hypothetical protein
MSKFLFTYHVPETSSPAAESTEAWTAWIESVSSHLVDRGNPIFESTSVGDAGPKTRLGGYSIVSADDLEGAVQLTKGCPAVEGGGGVKVGVITEM